MTNMRLARRSPLYCATRVLRSVATCATSAIGLRKHAVMTAALMVMASMNAAHAQAIWLSPKAPYPPAGIAGAPDLMRLFEPDAPWRQTSKRIAALQFSTQFLAWAPDDQLRLIINDMNRRGISLAIESLAQNDDTEPRCGQGVEGYGNPRQAANISNKVKRAGGALRYIAMDEPLYFGHYFDAADACRSSIANVAERVSQVLAVYRQAFPDVVIGDIEPAGAFRRPEWGEDYKAWVDLFRQKVGSPLAFLRLDIDWNDGDPGQALEAGVALAAANNQKLQVIYNGRDTDKTNEAWITSAQANIRLVRSQLPDVPMTVVFQSWVDHPTHVLPETDANTLTGLVAWYLQALTGQ